MTPQTISVEEAEKIIFKVANKELTFGCSVRCVTGINKHNALLINDGRDGYSLIFENNKLIELPNLLLEYHILGHPVLIGDVLEKMRQIDCHDTYILRLWGECGKLTDSLNDILDSSEKEEHTEWINDEGDHEEWGILKPNTPASNLFLFLNQLFN